MHPYIIKELPCRILATNGNAKTAHFSLSFLRARKVTLKQETLNLMAKEQNYAVTEILKVDKN